MSIREQKGQAIAKSFQVRRSNGLWLVPSQDGRTRYKVTPDQAGPRCTCPDFEFRQQKCKHIFAVEFTVKREQKTTVKTDLRGVTTTTTTTTETVKVKRPTYPQQWPAYNMAQTNEKRLFLYLLHQLCQGIGTPAQVGRGQRRLMLEDMIFAMAYKVYSTVSGRRFISDLRESHGKGYISQLPSYNSIFNYFESEEVTPYLQMLIEESSLPLTPIEHSFAVDSSGFSTCRFVQWVKAKYTDPKLVEERNWLKCHLICGTQTNVVTAVEVSDRYKNDSPYFKGLVERTEQNFDMWQVSGDKAYLSSQNLQAAIDARAMPYIPFKANSRTNERRHSPLWKKMYHFFSFNQEKFMKAYHKRSNVESTFMMIKAKFGDSLRSKTERAQINEILCKILCHNICCLIQAMHELNLKPKFYQAA
jgi:transposase